MTGPSGTHAGDPGAGPPVPPPPTPPLASPSGGDEAALLEAYLDGALSEGERAAFEAAIAGRADLRAEVALQRRIEAGVRRVVGEPPVLGVPTVGDAAVAGRIGGGGRIGDGGAVGTARRKRNPLEAWAAVAATLAVVGAAAWWGLREPAGPSYPLDTAEALYARSVGEGFTPQWVCADDAAFVAYTKERFGRPFLIASATAKAEGVELIGWKYGSVLSGKTAVLLARVDAGSGGAPTGNGPSNGAVPATPGGPADVMVVVDRSSNDRPVEVSKASGLHVYKKELKGGLTTPGIVLYEVSPLDHAVVLGWVEGR